MDHRDGRVGVALDFINHCSSLQFSNITIVPSVRLNCTAIDG